MLMHKAGGNGAMSTYDTHDGAGEPPHDPYATQFSSCWSALEVDDGRQIESLVSQLSSVDSLTIMSPKTDISEDTIPSYIAIDSCMVLNQAFDDGALEVDGDVDHAVVSRRLKPVRTRSSTLGSLTHTSSTPDVCFPRDGLLSGTRCVTPALSHSSSIRPHYSPDVASQNSSPSMPLLQQRRQSSLSPGKGLRLGKYLRAGTGSPAVWETGSPKLKVTKAPTRRAPSEHRQSSLRSDEDYFRMPTTRTSEQHSLLRSGSSGESSHSLQLTPRSMQALEQELAQHPAIQAHTRVLHECIQAMKQQLRCHDAGHPHAQAVPPCHPSATPAAASAPEAPAGWQAEGQPQIGTGVQPQAAAAVLPAGHWSQLPPMYPMYEMAAQRLDMGGVKHAHADRSVRTPGSRSSARTRSSSRKHGSRRSKGNKHPKSVRSVKSSAASAKCESARQGSSEDMFVGSSGKRDSQAIGAHSPASKPAVTATLPKGQTAAVSRALNEAEEEEQVSGGCLGQFWGANRKMKKKRTEIPRAPTIYAPVMESKGREGLGVRLGCL